MTPLDPAGGLRAVVGSLAEDDAVRAIGGRPVALGWATVELDRAISELAAGLGLDAARFTEVPPSAALGARCRLAAGAIADGIDLVLLEPSTEGRLAAALARHGEGPAAAWFEVASLEDAVGVLRRRGDGMTALDAGPLGPERLVVGGPIHGPSRLVVERPGTIRA